MAYDTNAQKINGIAGDAIGAFKIVERSGDDGVVLGSAGINPAGLSPSYATASGTSLPVIVGGVGQVKLGGTVAVDDSIKPDGVGDGIVASTGNPAIGRALRAGVDGDVIPIQVDIHTTA